MWEPAPPGAENDVQIGRKLSIGIYICIDDIRLFGEREELRIRQLSGNLRHMDEKLHIRNIARRKVAEEPRMEGYELYIKKEARRI